MGPFLFVPQAFHPAALTNVWEGNRLIKSLASERGHPCLLMYHHHCTGDDLRGSAGSQDCQDVHLGHKTNVSEVQQRPVHFRRISTRNVFVVLCGFGQVGAGVGNLSTIHPSMLANGNEMSIVIYKRSVIEKFQ